MKNFLHGLGGGVGRGIGRTLGFIIVIVIFYLLINFLDLDIKNDIISKILMLDVNASTVDITNKSRSSCDTSSTTNSRFGAFYNNSCHTLSFNSVTTGRANLLGFRLVGYNFESGVYYTFVINMTDNDLINEIDVVRIIDLAHNSTEISPLSYVQVSKSQFKLTFVLTQATSNLGISVTCGDSSQPITAVTNFGVKNIKLEYNDGGASDIINNNNENTSSIINNNNQNTQDIIDSDTTNTNNIINNQNQNTISIVETVMDSMFPVCSNGKKNLFADSDNSYLSSNGTVSANNNYFISLPVKIFPNQSYTLDVVDADGIYYGSYCFYDKYNTLITCTRYSSNTQTTYSFTSPNNSYFFRATLKKGKEVYLNATLKGNVCVSSSYDEKFENVKSMLTTGEILDSITDDSVDSNTGSNFFNNFNDNSHGLSSIITTPLTTIQSLTSQQCLTLNLPIPFTNNQTLNLPCMSQVYQENIPDLYQMWQVVCYGLIGYWIAIDIFHLVKGFKDPETDKVEVLDL